MTNKNKDINMEVNHAYQHNIYLKEMKFPDAGTTYCGHHHDYDHVTLVASGRVSVKFGAVPAAGIPEETREYSAVSMFVTRSFREHEITSLEPNTTVCCVHALRDENGEVVFPEIDDDHLHDPDHKFHSSKEVAATVGKRLGRMAFTASPIDLQKMFERGEKEGTLVPGSQDQLL